MIEIVENHIDSNVNSMSGNGELNVTEYLTGGTRVPSSFFRFPPQPSLRLSLATSLLTKKLYNPLIFDEMAPSVITIEQNFINMPNARLQVETIFETDLSTESITGLLNLAPSVPRAVGLAPGYTPAGLLTVLAIAVNSKVLLVQFRSKSKKDTDPIREARQTIQRELFGSTDNVFFAFNMAILAATLYLDTGLRVEHAVDIQDGCSCKENRVPANAVEFALNTTKHRAYKPNISAAFEEDVWDPARPPTTSLLALKAWLSGFLPGIADMEERFREVAQINLTIEKWPDVVRVRQTRLILCPSDTDRYV